MSKRNASFLTIFIYGFILFSPLFLRLIPAITTNKQLLTASAVSYLVGAFILLFVYQKSLRFAFEKKPSTIPRGILWGLAGIFISLVLQGIIAQIEALIFHTSPTSQNTQDIIKLIIENPLFIIATSIGAPMMEELVFRRAIFGALSDYFDQGRLQLLLTALFSSFCFALAHQDGHILLYMSLGLFFCFLYHHTGHIWTSMITHVGMNTLVVLVQLALHYSNVPLPT